MEIYILKANLISTLLYVFYLMIKRHDTFFSYRRFMLMSIILVSAILPLLHLPFMLQDNRAAHGIAFAYANWMLPVIPVRASPTVLTWKDVIMDAYLLGVTILAIRFFWRLISIFYLVHHTTRKEFEGTSIHVLPKGQGPFSFMQWIFLDPYSQTPEQLHEILLHEQTHVRQCHSLDILVSEMFCIFCWFNPFSWFLKGSIRLNLEYLADESVLDNGAPRKVYQYHLLCLAYHPTKEDMANQFNALQLKSRIKMMNKNRTNKWVKAKYLLFLPLVVGLLLVSNIESMARTGKDAVTYPSPYGKYEQVESAARQNRIYDHCDQMPAYPGGVNALVTFLSENVRYPDACRKAGLQGRVVVQFVVERNGAVSHVRVIHPVNAAFDAEAQRVVSSMSRWHPGYEQGQAMRVKYNIPISFHIK